jgi:hypothetical protein
LGHVDERIRVLPRCMSWSTNKSIRRPGKLAFGRIDALPEAFPIYLLSTSTDHGIDILFPILYH